MSTTVKNLTIADGQVAATATEITAGPGDHARRVNVTFTNVGGSSETLVLTLERNGGTARRIWRGVLAANEHLFICGLPLNRSDSLKATTTNAASVDYVISLAADEAAFSMTTLDANGARKQVDATAAAGAVAGNLTVTGYDLLGGDALGDAASVQRLVVKKTEIADNTATDLITVTAPNGEHAAALRLTFLGSLGTGDDTFESSRCAVGCVVMTRKTGVVTVAVAATLTLAQIATLAGGATLTLAYGVSAISGAAGAVNTFTVQVTLVKTGTVDDHQCVVLAELVNAEASGITIAAS